MARGVRSPEAATPALPPRPPQAPPPASAAPRPAHLALADAEDAAAAAQAHTGIPGLRGRAAERERTARGEQPPHRGAHERGRPAPPARPQVQVAERDEHGRPAAEGRWPGTLALPGRPAPPLHSHRPEGAEPRGSGHAGKWGVMGSRNAGCAAGAEDVATGAREGRGAG